MSVSQKSAQYVAIAHCGSKRHEVYRGNLTLTVVYASTFLSRSADVRAMWGGISDITVNRVNRTSIGPAVVTYEWVEHQDR